MHLPPPIELYFASDRSDDSAALATRFGATATLIDEGRAHEEVAAITAWRIEAMRAYHYTVEPVEPLQQDGKTVVAARLAGDFSGRPVTLAYVFTLESDKIASLEIRS